MRRREFIRSIAAVGGGLVLGGATAASGQTKPDPCATPQPPPTPSQTPGPTGSPSPHPSPSHSHTPGPSPTPSPIPSSPPPAPEVDRVLTGFVSGGFTVPAGETWKIEGTVETDRNAIVLGKLVGRGSGDPSNPTRLRFVGVSEAAMAGSGMDPLPSDVGLWVMGDGELDFLGSPKVAWTRTGADPSWLPADELVIAPTAPGDHGSSGFAPFTQGQAVPQVDPRVPATEVLNLSRDLVIEGTPGGRSHVFVRSTRPQAIRHVLFQNLGPRKNGLKVTGRWPVHFHHMGGASAGTIVEGCVVRYAGSHAYVPHNSHGITFRDCIAYDVQETPYWWDDPTVTRPSPDNFTNGTSYERCVAAFVKPGDDGRGLRLSGFHIGLGTVQGSNRATGCVAVGVLGDRTSSGFHWPEEQQDNQWVVEDCVAHNNAIDGAFVWWNSGRPQAVQRFVAYHNGKAGIEQGAYVNEFLWAAPILLGNRQCGVLNHAHSRSLSARIRYERPVIEGSPIAFQEGIVHRTFAANPPALVCAPASTCPVLIADGAHPSRTFELC